MSAEKDCFWDDGVVLDMVLKEQGVKGKLDYYPGLPHYFHAFPQLGIAHEMMLPCPGTRRIPNTRW